MDKEEVLFKFEQMIRTSWTYEKLTIEEKNRFQKVIYSEQVKSALKGNYKQRWAILHAVYTSFLMALDYTPIGWREEEKVLPLF